MRDSVDREPCPYCGREPRTFRHALGKGEETRCDPCGFSVAHEDDSVPWWNSLVATLRNAKGKDDVS